MAILDPLLLPSDVAIVPVAQLPPELLEQIEHEPGDFSVTRPLTRTTSSIVDAQTAALLECFREPATIVDAVIAYSGAQGTDPRATLDEAFGVLGGFVSEGLLVAADSELARPIATTLAPGDEVGGLTIVEAVHVIVDTEVYRARTAGGGDAALKIARAGAAGGLRRGLAHEAEALGALDGAVNPRLLELGEHDERPYLAVSWCAGVDVHRAAAEARALGDGGRDELLALGEATLAAYAHLHEQDVLHGDVHPRNVVVDGDGTVAIIDFGLAARPAAPGAVAAGGRGGIDFFMEPEVAAARLARRHAPALTEAGEQYSIATLLYLLLTGTHTHAFSLEHEEMLRQLLDEPPRSFADHGVSGLGAVEAVLARALAKDPAQRHASVAAMRDAFAAAAASDRAAAAPPAAGTRRPSASARLLDDVLARLALGGELAAGIEAPTASAMNGGAGFGYALLRVAAIRQDEELLALADLWVERAAHDCARGLDEAFWNADLEIVPEQFGRNSFFHTAAGVHAVQALVARGRGDDWAHALALRSFLDAAGAPCEHVDVTFGRSGLLLGCALMLGTLAPGADEAPLRALGDGLRDSLWCELERHAPLDERPELRALGAAHGWAGFLFALLRWSEAAGGPPPAGIEARLAQLAAQAQPAGRGLRWPHEPGAPAPDSALGASWCNGAAGYVGLWTLAERLLGGDEGYGRLARGAAWAAYEGTHATVGDLCCGFAGRAYALLSLHRHSGEAAWVARAGALADLAAARVRSGTLRRDSLYKGEVGVALLAAELEAPADACMPLYEAAATTSGALPPAPAGTGPSS